MKWLSDNYKWLFDGVGGALVVALLAYVAQKLFRSKTGQETVAGKPASDGRQAAALLVITPKLEGALFNLRRAASGDKRQGEVPDQELLRRMGVDLAAASTEYSQKKLLIDVSLTHKIDEFFSKVVSAGISLNHALDPMTPNHWRRAQEIADKELPPLLQAIQTDSRAVIHRYSSDG